MKFKGITALAAIGGATVLITCASPAAADVFSGPWDSAHQPPTITNPGIDVGPLDRLGTFVIIPMGPNSACPASLAVTYADPAGSITETVTGTPASFGSCQTSATQTTTGSPDFSIDYNNAGPGPTFGYGSVSKTAVNGPFLYTVTDPTGVIAQGAYTTSSGTFHIYSGTSDFNTLCLDGHHTLYSDDTGRVYCLQYEVLDTPGWPAPTPPPVPPAPAPAPPPAPAPSPAPPPAPTPPAKPLPRLSPYGPSKITFPYSELDAFSVTCAALPCRITLTETAFAQGRHRPGLDRSRGLVFTMRSQPGSDWVWVVWFGRSDINQGRLKNMIRRYGSVRLQINAKVVDALGRSTTANRAVTISNPSSHTGSR